MRHVLLTLACLVIPSLALSAPADSTTTSAPRNSLRGGVWALQFDVNGQLLSVNSFAGGVSLKRQFSPKSAVRFGIGVGGSSQFREDVTPSNPQATSDDQGASIEALYQRYWNPAAVVNAFWAVGPVASYAHDSSEQNNSAFKNVTEINYKSVGGVLALGAEWFAARQFSFHAEYSARGAYSWQDQSSTTYSPGAPPVHHRGEVKGWNVGTTNGVRLGLSVYF